MAIGFTPQFSQDIQLNNLSKEHFIVIAHEAVTKMGWQILYASQNGMIIYTNKGVFTSNANIKIINNNGVVSISSASSGSEIIDFGKNRKNVLNYISQFEEIFKIFPAEDLDSKYEVLRESLNKDEADILLEPEENGLKSFLSIFIPVNGYFITPILVIINILMFIIMICNGISFISPDAESMLNWGANFKPLTLEGEGYRLFTNIFIHFGVLHVLLNMYALVYIGMLLEPRLGKAKFLCAYFMAGILASVASLWWNDLVVSAGASGAIFGMYGVFLALLCTNIIEKSSRKPLLTSIGIFVVINLFYGVTNKGIDNAAHFGGLISGFFIGLIFIPSLKKGTTLLKYSTLTIIFILTIIISSFTLNNTSNDFEAYQITMNEFMKNETKALEYYKLSDNTTDGRKLSAIKNVGIPYWRKNIALLDKIEKMSLSAHIQETNKELRKYCSMRLESYDLIYKAIIEDTHAYDNRINTLNNDIETPIKRLESNQ